MIKGKLKKNLSMDSVLSRCSDLEIFTHFMPNKGWTLNEATLSPFRVEKTPSFVIGNKMGYISYIDWGAMEFKGDCFNFVKQLHNLPNLDSVLRLIDTQLNLGISNGSEIRSEPIIKIQQPEVHKRNTLIQVITRKFSKEELAYWNQYFQSEDDLRKDNVYSIKKAFLNKKQLSLADLRFGYYYDGWWKIYSPNEDKRKKWLSNVPLTVLDGKENIKDCKTAIITKAKKDKMILRKIYNCVCSTQNESMACFSKENVDYIKANSEKQYILFDSDLPGKQASLQVTKKFDMGYCNVPNNYLDENIKDFAGWASKYGLKVVEEYLKEKQLI